MSHAEKKKSTRRDFLYVATAATGVVATGAAAWPLVNQMNPSAEVLALSSIEVDVTGVDVGTQLTVKWRGKPIFIRRRSEKEIKEGRAVKLSQLVDTNAENENKPGTLATDQNRTLDKDGQWLVMIGICTHLGCVPLGNHSGKYGGWFCPCHGSYYDSAGRIRQGPAPRNLEIPINTWVETNKTIKLG